MTKQLVYREDDVVSGNLETLADQNHRKVSDEIRAATAVYLGLVNLAHLRITVARQGQEDRLRDVERRLQDDIGRILLAALPADVQSRFENDAGVEYPVDRFGKIHVPFDKLLGWIATQNS